MIIHKQWRRQVFIFIFFQIFADEQLRQGAILLYFIGAIYFFSLLTVICNDYFIPSVECICTALNISKDVAAATFMATATSTPEFFTNVISTFITDSDLGLGTIIGSLMFNTLGVAALAGLAAKKPVQLEWWPITRDSLLYAINLSVLIGFAWDGAISWYEGMVLVIMYFLYFIVMFQNDRIMKLVKSVVINKFGWCTKNTDGKLLQLFLEEFVVIVCFFFYSCRSGAK